jgi:hypothetical protein
MTPTGSNERPSLPRQTLTESFYAIVQRADFQTHYSRSSLKTSVHHGLSQIGAGQPTSLDFHGSGMG